MNTLTDKELESLTELQRLKYYYKNLLDDYTLLEETYFELKRQYFDLENKWLVIKKNHNKE